MADDGNKDSVTISPEVFALLVAHAASHPTTTVHGVLIGNRKSNKVDVTDAFPICHENPTRPLVETALALVQSNLEGETNKYIVGWFTAPELLYETKPGPVALRIVASLAASSRGNSSSSSGEPVLLSLNNEKIVNILAEKESLASKAVQAYGKDFGMQWMEPLDLTVSNESAAVKAVTDIFNEKFNINDLVDHWDEGASSEWTLASSLSSFTKKFN